MALLRLERSRFGTSCWNYHSLSPSMRRSSGYRYITSPWTPHIFSFNFSLTSSCGPSRNLAECLVDWTSTKDQPGHSDRNQGCIRFLWAGSWEWEDGCPGANFSRYCSCFYCQAASVFPFRSAYYSSIITSIKPPRSSTTGSTSIPFGNHQNPTTCLISKAI